VPTASRSRVSRKPAPAGRLATLAALIGNLLEFSAPADGTMSRFFKSHPEMGARDRHFYAESAWAVLRNLSWFEHLAHATAKDRLHWRLAILGVLQAQEPLPPEADRDSTDRIWREGLPQVESAEVDPFLRESIPAWIAQALIAAIGAQEARACAHALRQTAPLDLRVNTIRASVADVQAMLSRDGIQAQPLAALDGALRIEGKPALQRSRAFREGFIEVQDLGSQIIAALVAARRGEFIVDFCAGAGGKTLALGSAMDNTGRLYALDTSAARLARFKPRLVRSGLSNVWPIAISGLNDDRIKRLSLKAHAVLVDAPCSGLGTLRRNPDLKWRIGPESVATLQQQQEAILRAASRLVRPGGRLIYATCSLLPQENEALVERFLSGCPEFSRVPAAEVLARQRIRIPSDWQPLNAAGDLMLWPHRAGSDGFFAACMVRAGS